MNVNQPCNVISHTAQFYLEIFLKYGVRFQFQRNLNQRVHEPMPKQIRYASVSRQDTEKILQVDHISRYLMSEWDYIEQLYLVL